MTAKCGFDLTGERIFLTGAARGMGQGMARTFAAWGATVGAADIDEARARDGGSDRRRCRSVIVIVVRGRPRARIERAARLGGWRRSPGGIILLAAIAGAATIREGTASRK